MKLCALWPTIIFLTAGWSTKVQIKVIDESGAPMSGVSCEARFARALGIGSKVDTVKGCSAIDGLFSAEGETIASPRCSIASDSDEYYESAVCASLTNMYEVVVRKKGTPINLIKDHSQICEFSYPLEKVEYDCFLCDYLPPYGKGKQSDFTIYLKGGVRDLSDPEERDKSYWYDTRLIVSQGKGGFVLGKTTPESEYFYTRVADSTWNWKPEMHYWVKGRDGGQKTRFNYVKNHMVFRVVRKVADVDHYYYGVIRRFSVRIGIPDKSRRIDIETMINPNPDDPNIEFNGHALKPQDPKAPVAKAAEK